MTTAHYQYHHGGSNFWYPMSGPHPVMPMILLWLAMLFDVIILIDHVPNAVPFVYVHMVFSQVLGLAKERY